VFGCLTVKGTNTRLGTRNFSVVGAKIWNSLPADLPLPVQSVRTFGQKLKQYLPAMCASEDFYIALYKSTHFKWDFCCP